MAKVIGIFGVEDGKEGVVKKTKHLWMVVGYNPKSLVSDAVVFAFYEDAKKEFDKRMELVKKPRYENIEIHHWGQGKEDEAWVWFDDCGRTCHIRLKTVPVL